MGIIHDMEARGIRPDAFSWSTLLAVSRYHGHAELERRARGELERVMVRRGGGDGGGEGVGQGQGEEGGGGRQRLEHSAPQQERWRGYYQLDDEDDAW